MDTIAGALVLYHPDYNVLDNIHSYIDDIDRLFIYDNSEKVHDPELIGKIKSITKVCYQHDRTNSGIAAALNSCARKALASGYKWLLTMDQDSRADKNMIREMLEFRNNFPQIKVGIFAPQHVNPLTPAHNFVSDYQEVKIVMTSGNLLNLDAYLQTGQFNEDFFIDYVDIEYCLRLLNKGFKVLLCSKSILYHQLGDISKHKLFVLFTFYTTNHSPLRLYYITRNMFTTWNNHKESYNDLYANDIKYFYKRFFKILFFEKNKLKKFKHILQGYFDYKKSKLGKFGQ